MIYFTPGGSISGLGTLTMNGAGVFGGYVQGKISSEDHTANDTLVDGTSDVRDKVHTNVGATGTVVITMDAATVGNRMRYAVYESETLRVDPDGTDHILGATDTAGDYLECSTPGGALSLYCIKAGYWHVDSMRETWTEETP